MSIVHLAAGAAGMYCGSCMHDNRLVAALRAQGRDAVLVPLYTPLRTDEADVSQGRVYYGGINVYLQQISRLFRRTPWLLDRLFDSPVLLRLMSRLASTTRPDDLGEMTVSVMRGEEGPQRKELAKLIAGLRRLRPTIVHLPNLLFVGLARPLKAELDVPVLCTLAGEDIFVDRLPEPHRQRVLELIRSGSEHVDGFIGLTDAYAKRAVSHFGIPSERVHRLPLSIRTTDFDRSAAPPATPFTIGYLARICEDKGIEELGRAFVRLRNDGRDCRLRIAGFLGRGDRPVWKRVQRMLCEAGAGDAFEYVGDVTREEKLQFLHTLHVLSVPAMYPESKGFYVLEALAAGVPVVEPNDGSFPELLEATSGGLLFEARNTAALADALARLMDDPPLRQRLAEAGRATVHSEHTTDKMASAAWALYTQFM